VRQQRTYLAFSGVHELDAKNKKRLPRRADADADSCVSFLMDSGTRLTWTGNEATKRRRIRAGTPNSVVHSSKGF